MIKRKITVKVNYKKPELDSSVRTPIDSTQDTFKKQKTNESLSSVMSRPGKDLLIKCNKKNSNAKYRYLSENYKKNYKKFQPLLNTINLTSPDELRTVTPFNASFNLKSEPRIPQSREIKSIIARIAKFNITQMKKQTLQGKLEDKNRRFNLRQRKNEIIEIKKAWIVLEILASTPFIIKCLVGNRKKLKKRSKQRMVWFRRICACIGKIRCLIKKIKTTRALRKITRFVKYIKIWLNKVRLRKQKTLVSIIESTLNSSVYLKLYLFWNMRILKIQRWIRAQLKIKAFLYEDLLKMWAKKEFEIFKNIANKPDNHYSQFFRISIIPESKKLQYIKNKIKEIMKNYILMKNEYLVNIEKFEYSLRCAIFQTENSIDFRPVKPKKPNIRKMFFKTEILRELIHLAMTERSQIRSRRK